MYCREFFRKRRYLGASDRRWIADRFFGVLRHLTLLDAVCRAALHGAGGKHMPPIALVAAHAVRVAGEDPHAVASAVDTLWRMAGLSGTAADFASALPGVTLPPSQTATRVERIALEQSFPPSIVAEWVERLGEQEAEELCRASNQPGPAAIRVNSLLTDVKACRAALALEGVDSRPGTVSRDALVLPGRVNLPSLKAFRDGMFEMQDEGSQLIVQLLDPRPGETVIDACAGGGGKALHAAAQMKNQGRIIAADTDGRRLEQLRIRLPRSGAHIIEIVPPPSRREVLGALKGKADAVLVDAPCSGVGTFRRAPDAKLRFTERTSRAYAATQRELLEEHAPLVRPGGRLVYATCTLLRRENEDILNDFLARHSEFRPAAAAEVSARTGITPPEQSFLLLLPHRTGTDGFFAGLLLRES